MKQYKRLGYGTTAATPQASTTSVGRSQLWSGESVFACSAFARPATSKPSAYTLENRSASGVGPEEEALPADSVGLALLGVLNVLTPAEGSCLHAARHLPGLFNEIGTVMEHSPSAVKMLPRRARRRVRGANEPRFDQPQPSARGGSSVPEGDARR